MCNTYLWGFYKKQKSGHTEVLSINSSLSDVVALNSSLQLRCITLRASLATRQYDAATLCLLLSLAPLSLFLSTHFLLFLIVS
jgi:hypothetical protein